MKRAAVRAALLLAASLLALGGCVAPARSDSAYEARAAETAKTALAQVQTARLAIRAAAARKATAPYLSVLLSDTETTLSEVTDTFASIQPPSPTSDDLRDKLGKVLSDAEDTLSALRITIRRGQVSMLREVGRPLDKSASDLAAYVRKLS
jgi:hypothetical protein